MRVLAYVALLAFAAAAMPGQAQEIVRHPDAPGDPAYPGCVTFEDGGSRTEFAISVINQCRNPISYSLCMRVENHAVNDVFSGVAAAHASARHALPTTEASRTAFALVHCEGGSCLPMPAAECAELGKNW